jgi:putative ABC transport system ATP-binding protein
MDRETEQREEFLRKYVAVMGEEEIEELARKASEAEAAAPAAAGQADYVVFENVRKVYHVGEVDIEALADASFSVNKGELAVVVGESGAGKTTLLNILGGMDTLTSGRVILDGREISKMDLRELTKYRRYDIGFVFQFYNLVQNLTALENVSLATQICKDPLDPAETLRAVGLGDRMNNFPGQLSGGEQQRVAIARALAKNPKLLLCDEPTGALDYNTGKAILQLLQDQARNSGTTVIIITHNKAITPMADRVISVRSGRVQDVRINPAPVPISEIEW